MLVFSLILVFLSNYLTLGFQDLDGEKYDDGRRQLDIIQKNAAMPKYGRCWTNAVQAIVSGCKRLTDVEQTRLALAYLNCFLEVQGREPYICNSDEDLQVCTKYLSDADRASFATFFTHTQNICYFLEAQIWHEHTENTITRLSTNSEEVAAQLEETSTLQHEVIRQQNISLHNQNRIIDQASNLSLIINASSNNIHGMFNEFKKSTNEQRLLINDVFDRVSNLQSTILGEFSWFYSVLYYTLSIVICYLLTSTNRTSAARFWLFGIMTANILTEKLVLYGIGETSGMFTAVEQADEDARLYQSQWLCRKVSAVIGLIVLVVCAYRYHDINVVNNQLLLDIKKQNLELKHFLQGGVKKKAKKPGLKSSVCDSNVETIREVSTIDTTGYESESTDGDFNEGHLHGNSANTSATLSSTTPLTDPTYSPDNHDLDSESSFSTARSKISQGSRSSKRSSSLQRELRNLQNSTPFKEWSDNLLSWATSGCYKITGKGNDSAEVPTLEVERQMTRSRSNSPSPCVSITNNLTHNPCPKSETPSRQRYFLRQRKSSTSKDNPVVQSESPRSFAKKVKGLEKLAVKNSRFIRNKIIHEERLTVSSEDEK